MSRISYDNGAPLELFITGESKDNVKKSEIIKDDQDAQNTKINEEIKIMYNVRGTSGLQNLGNTCYMNAGLQCLSAIDIFTTYMFSKKFVKRQQLNIMQKLANDERKKKKLSDTSDVEIDNKDIIKIAKKSVTYGYYHLMKNMWSDIQTVNPDVFKSIIGSHNEVFRGYTQQDSQELINFTLDNIHEELKTTVDVNYIDVPECVIQFRDGLKLICDSINNVPNEESANLISIYKKYLDENMREYVRNTSLEYWEKYIKKSHSIIRDIFTGMTYTSTKCMKCGITSLAFEPYLMLDLAIPSSDKPVSIEECFKNFSKEQKLSGENKYKCNTCKEYNDAIQTTHIWEPPEVLIIHFKRFSNKMIGKRCHMEKNLTKITYPLTNLDLSSIYSPHINKDVRYELKGVVQQYGSLNGGHYTACCKNHMNDKWYSYDDSRVNGIPDDKVEDHIVCKSAYILFYVKQYNSMITDDEM